MAHSTWSRARRLLVALALVTGAAALGRLAHPADDAIAAAAVAAGEPVAAEAPAECNAHAHAGFDGHAFTWGMSFRVADAAECCAACKAHAELCGGSAPPRDPPVAFWKASGQQGETFCGDDATPERVCNVWVYCGEPKCWSNDIHDHTLGECWLKHQDDPSRPRSPSRGAYPASFRAEHTTAPELVQWTSGALTDAGVPVVPGDPSWGKSTDGS